MSTSPELSAAGAALEVTFEEIPNRFSDALNAGISTVPSNPGEPHWKIVFSASAGDVSALPRFGSCNFFAMKGGCVGSAATPGFGA